MRRVLAGIAVVVAVAVAALLWWRSRDGATGGGNAGDGAAGGGPRIVLGGGDNATAAELPAWFGARGAPARRIAGRVTFEGEPVESARVVLSSLLHRADVAESVVQVTKPDGRFDFGELPAATYQLGASAPDKTAAVATLNLADPTLKPPPDQLELKLTGCAATLYGTVYDGSGGVVNQARVQRLGIIGTVTGADGGYELCVPRSETEIEFSADGYSSVTMQVYARGRVKRDVALVPEAIIVGKVVRADDGQPIGGAFVEAYPREWGRERPSPGYATTGADGAFRIAGLAPAVFRVHARHDGLATPPAGVQVLAEAGTESREIVLRLEAVARLRGVVLASGKPVAGETVSAVRESPLANSHPATTQADGSFVLDAVPLGEVVFDVTGYEVSSPQRFAVPDASERDGIVINVTQMGAIRGTVRRLGKPVAGVPVCCTFVGPTRQSISDDDGRYEFKGLPAGSYELIAGNEEAFHNPVKIELAAGEQREVDLEMDLAGTITGDVVDQHGNPVEGVTVKYFHKGTGDLCETVTDSRGAYRCGAMTGGGDYVGRVYASADVQSPYQPAEGATMPVVTVEDGTSLVENVRIRIQLEELSIGGRVVDADGGPVPDASVRALAANKDNPARFASWFVLPSAVTDVDGRFSIKGLTTGDYALQARAAGGGEATSDPVPAGTSDVELVLERPGTIEGTLVGFTDPPTVYATVIGTTFRLDAGIVDDTTFRVVGLRPGRYLVNAQTTFEGQAAIAEVRAGETTHVTLTAGGRGSIHARVIEFESREPIAGATCHVVAANGGVKGITNWDHRTAPKSDEQGVIVLDPAPAGEMVVDCMPPSFRFTPPSAEVVVPRSGEASVELLSVRAEVDYLSTTGTEFDWRRVPPIISAVAEDSPAAAAGLRAGELVVAVDGASVDGVNGLGVQRLINGRKTGQSVSVTVQRGTEAVTATMRTVARKEW